MTNYATSISQPVRRKVGEVEHVLPELNAPDLDPWCAEKRQHLQAKAREILPPTGLTLDQRKREHALIERIDVNPENLKGDVTSAAGVVRVLTLSAKLLGVTDPDAVDRFIRAKTWRENQADAARVSGVFSPAEVAYYFPDTTGHPAPVLALIDTLEQGTEADVDLLAADLKVRVAARVAAEKKAEAAAKQPAVEVPSPNDDAPATDPGA